MNYTHHLVYYRTITPVHVGCGQAVGVVDLPLIRERATGYPYFPGSGIRGSMRDQFELNDRELAKTLFGPESEEEPSEYAGCISILDARLLFFPVRSDRNVFHWISCPLVLQRYNRDREAFGVGNPLTLDGLKSVEEDKFIGPYEPGRQLHLEEFCFEAAEGNDDTKKNLGTIVDNVGTAINESDLGNRLLLVSNKAFAYFVNHATMLTQHNKLTSAKTVAQGALFSIESLPPETILYGIIGTTDERKDPDNGKKQDAVWSDFQTTLFNGNGNTTYLHLGGKESTGLGVTQLILAENSNRGAGKTQEETHQEDAS